MVGLSTEVFSLGPGTACQGKLYVHSWTLDNTYPFLVQVLNPLVFPTCNVLYHFQSNTQLAPRKVMKPEGLFLQVCEKL